MDDFEWVDEVYPDVSLADIKSQVDHYNSFCVTARLFSKWVGIGIVIFLIVTWLIYRPVRYWSLAWNVPSTPDESVELFRGFWSVLETETPSAWIRGGQTNVLPFFAGAIGSLLLLEFVINALRLRRISVVGPSEASEMTYRALADIKQDNNEKLSRAEYLITGMRLKGLLFLPLLLLSMYTNALHVGRGVMTSDISVKSQLIFLNATTIAIIISATVYILWKAGTVILRLVKSTESLQYISLATIRELLRVNYSGVFGVFSTVAVLLAVIITGHLVIVANSGVP